MNLNITRALFDGNFQAICIDSETQNVTIGGCTFVNSFCESNGGSIFVRAYSVALLNNCVIKAKSKKVGGFSASISNKDSEHVISYCSMYSCVGEEGPIIRQWRGFIFYSNSNMSKGSGIYGGYEDEINDIGCTISYAAFFEFVATKYSVCSIQQTAGTNNANHLIFDNCTSLNPSSLGVFCSYFAQSTDSYIYFIRNKIETFYLFNQLGDYYAYLSNSYFDPSNKCVGYILSTNVIESNRIDDDPKLNYKFNFENCFFLTNCKSEFRFEKIIVFLSFCLISFFPSHFTYFQFP